MMSFFVSAAVVAFGAAMVTHFFRHLSESMNRLLGVIVGAGLVVGGYRVHVPTSSILPSLFSFLHTLVLVGALLGGWWIVRSEVLT